MSSLAMLWDESHIWGLLAWRAIREMGFPCRMVRAQDIAGGALAGKSGAEPPKALIVPGGVARRKAEKLGDAGMDAIREFTASGGTYLGFCGGAGLGLTGQFGLDLCPWQRAAIKERMLHLASGHIHVTTPQSHPLLPESMQESPLLPVWWPARFEPQSDNAVQVLATYSDPGDDFWMADLPLNQVPDNAISHWRETYGVQLRPDFLTGQPCVISGEYGQGRYLLSYSHLETPRSADANRWFAHLLTTALGKDPRQNPIHEVPAWHLYEQDIAWDDPVLVRAVEIMDEIIAVGTDHFLLFQRNCWLLGWRAGIPGSNINMLSSLLRTVAAQEPTEEAERFFSKTKEKFGTTWEKFHSAVTGYFLAERLAMTLSKAYPDAVSQQGLLRERTALFGHPMQQGGVYAELVEVLEELVWLGEG
ncbi:MAG: biotin--protein ligase [Desulfovibrio sp.]|nr:MAG: biotin--protein ligase [Desulfovibrio sp.]